MFKQLHVKMYILYITKTCYKRIMIFKNSKRMLLYMKLMCRIIWFLYRKAIINCCQTSQNYVHVYIIRQQAMCVSNKNMSVLCVEYICLIVDYLT